MRDGPTGNIAGRLSPAAGTRSLPVARPPPFPEVEPPFHGGVSCQKGTDMDLLADESEAGGTAHGAEPAVSVRFLDLTDDRCAFIADDPASVSIGELRCCGLPVGPAGSLLGARYCPGHRAVVLVPRTAGQA